VSDISHDEVRRELRDIDREQRAVGSKLGSAFARLFDRDNGLSSAERAGVLGVPGRRQFLQFGGLAVAGAAVLAACGGDDDDSSGAGATTTTAMGSTTTTADSGSMDLTLAKTAASLEKLAVDTYQTAIDSGLVTTAAIGDAAKLFQEHHQAHFDALNGVVTQSGADAITEANAAVKEAIVDPAVAAAKAEADIVALAFTLEDAAAQTYVFAATQLSTPELRSTIMTIGGVEARHRALLAFVAQQKAPAEIFPAAFFESSNPLPAAALVK
jgi:hypothetical protein